MSSHSSVGVSQKISKYYLKPFKTLLFDGEIGFLFGAVAEKLSGRNPYFWYLKRRGVDHIVTRQVRGREMRIDLFDRGVSRHLFTYGERERAATDAYAAALRSVSNRTADVVTVLDIGANIGYFVLEASAVVGDRGEIYALEPDPQNMELLSENVELNGCSDRVIRSPKAIAATTGKQRFCRAKHSNWSGLDNEGNSDCVDRFEVETTTIEGFLEEMAVTPDAVNAVRMDLEGHELTVLEEMDSILTAPGPTALFIEFHPAAVETSRYEAVLRSLEAHGFTIQHTDTEWGVLDITTFEELRAFEGSHIRVILEK